MLQKPFRKFLLLIPRDHLKSTFVTGYYPIQQLLRDPDERILISSYSADLAKTFLNTVKKGLTHHKITKLYGPLAGDTWSKGEITIATRLNPNIKEPSVTTSSLDSPSTSQHYSTIILDDLVNDMNITSPEQMENVYKYYLECLNLLDKKDGKMIIIGTRWHKDDLYGRLIKKLGKVSPDNKDEFMVVYIRGLKDEFDTTKYIYPSRFNEDVERRLKDEYKDNMHRFYCQYYNNPEISDISDFKESWFKSYKHINLETKYNCVITLDPASSKRKHSNNTGIVVSLVDQYKNVYVDRCVGLKLGTTGTIEMLFKLHKQYSAADFVQHTFCGCEADGLQEYLIFGLKERMKTENYHFNVEPLSHKYTAKIDRIKGLQPYYKSGKIYHREGECRILEEELKWLGSVHPDVADAFAYQIALWIPPVIMNAVSKTAIAEWIESCMDQSEQKEDWYNRTPRKEVERESIFSIKSNR